VTYSFVIEDCVLTVIIMARRINASLRWNSVEALVGIKEETASYINLPSEAPKVIIC